MVSAKKKLHILWVSANKFGYELLKEAIKIEGIDICGIITLVDSLETKMYDEIDKKKWYKFNIPVYEIKRLNDEVKLIHFCKPDVIILCGWRQIVNKTIIDIPKKGCIGFHPTLLPKGRGPAPVINTILEEYQVSGVTMFYLDEQVDHGDIIGQVKFIVAKNDHANDLYKKIINSGKKLVRNYFPLFCCEKVVGVKQDESEATYFLKRTKKDNEISLNDDPDMIHKRIKAFSKPYSGAFLQKNGKKIIFWRSEM